MQKKTYSIKILDWDSKQLGIKVAHIDRFDTKPNDSSGIHKLIEAIKKDCLKNKIKYLLARFDISNWNIIQCFLDNDFMILDIILKWRLVLSNILINNTSKAKIRPFKETDLPFLMKIAKESFIFDRFHSDLKISKNCADLLHAEWIRNACHGFCDMVLVALVNKTPVGFISLNYSQSNKSKVGIIDLVAVDAKCRGYKIGQSLVNSSLTYFKKTVNEVEVGTQLRNLSAWKLYQKVGFKLQGSSATLRKYF